MIYIFIYISYVRILYTTLIIQYLGMIILYMLWLLGKMSDLLQTEVITDTERHEDYLPNCMDADQYIKILKFYRQVPSHLVQNYRDNIRLNYKLIECVEKMGIHDIEKEKTEKDSLCLCVQLMSYNKKRSIKGVSVGGQVRNIFFVPFGYKVTLFPNKSNNLKYRLYNVFVHGMDETLRYIKYPNINDDGFLSSLSTIESNNFSSLRKTFKGQKYVLFGYDLNPFEYLQVYALMKLFNTKPKLRFVYKKKEIYSFDRYIRDKIHFIGGKVKKIGHYSDFDDYNVVEVTEYLTLWSLKLK